jgi:hypothetical protein
VDGNGRFPIKLPHGSGRNYDVAEAQNNVVGIPVILEVAEVELEVTVRVSVHVRHPVVAVGVLPKVCAAHHPFHRGEHRHSPVFYPES